MNKIYTLGTMQIDLDSNSSRINSRRLWYFFANFEDAEKWVLENGENIFEYYYNVALIEEYPVFNPKDIDDAFFNLPQQWWYKCHFPLPPFPDNIEVPLLIISKIETPPQFKNICNFWAG
jgi:hypothetical protein